MQDDVYWTDWDSKSILKVNKLREVTGDDVQSVADQLLSPMDIHIYHKLKQPQDNNACASRVCSHICLPTPDYPGFTCACPNNQAGITTYTLSSDQRTCLVNTPHVSQNSGVLLTRIHWIALDCLD